VARFGRLQQYANATTHRTDLDLGDPVIDWFYTLLHRNTKHACVKKWCVKAGVPAICHHDFPPLPLEQYCTSCTCLICSQMVQVLMVLSDPRNSFNHILALSPTTTGPLIKEFCYGVSGVPRGSIYRTVRGSDNNVQTAS
jgi:hypothetical protein